MAGESATAAAAPYHLTGACRPIHCRAMNRFKVPLRKANCAYLSATLLCLSIAGHSQNAFLHTFLTPFFPYTALVQFLNCEYSGVCENQYERDPVTNKLSHFCADFILTPKIYNLAFEGSSQYHRTKIEKRITKPTERRQPVTGVHLPRQEKDINEPCCDKYIHPNIGKCHQRGTG
jgi:hypothetical protein